MFERYTEPARRVVFFARFEASAFGSRTIDTHHLLLGMLHESRDLFMPFLKSDSEIDSIRKELEARFPATQQVDLHVDLPLTGQATRALKQAAREADVRNDHEIRPQHLLLGLLQEEGGVVPEILERYGLTYGDLTA